MKKTQLTTEHLTEIEKGTDFYLAHIRQIDTILERPVKTLIRLAEEGRKQGEKIPSPAKQLFYFPTWISQSVEPEKKDYLFTQSVCCATLQRLWRLRRRFSWLDKGSHNGLQTVHRELVDSFTAKTPSDFNQCVGLLYSETLGGLNPLTASQVFRVLMEAGEDHAHAGMGFLAFFATMWSLHRSFPDRLTIGARIEPWEVTAYVTAKCVLPIKALQKVINMRARLLDDIAGNLGNLVRLANGGNSRESWEFNTQLDDLGANLSNLSRYSINGKAFKDCEDAVEQTRDTLAGSNGDICKKVLKDVGTALILVRDKSVAVLGEAQTMVDNIKKNILEHLKSPEAERDIALAQLTRLPLGLKFAEEYLTDTDYWNDLATAATNALKCCDDALAALNAACKICPQIKKEDYHTVGKDDSKEAKQERIRTALELQNANLEQSICKALAELAEANRNIGGVLNESVEDAARWCRSVVDREIAHVSAENLTDFDPSELVSAIAVAVAWRLITTPLQVSDAVTKAIAGARRDGSWRSGKPFYSPNHAFGIWAGTSDIVWTLTSAIEQFPGVREADDELFNYVNWLERTQITLEPKLPATQTGQTRESDRLAPQTEQSNQPSKPFVGWASERLRDRRKIHLATTALSINALLEIRDLAEYRLWQLCKKRFSVVSIDKLLKEIDPVDLGAAHSKRLHRRLARMAREAQEHNYKDAEYSLVLHGPPGSSKTKMAEALSAEMWKFSSRWGPKESRLIRITPADFTRLGEDRLDSEARVIFDLISGVRAVTIFFDEIDDLLRQRNPTGDRPTFMELVVPAMLNRLADLRSACPRQEICFLLATNYVENIDSALIRKGRIDDSIAVVYPDFESRMALIGSYVKEEEEKQVAKFLNDLERCKEFARETKGWPYLAIISSCDVITKELKAGWKGDESKNKTLFEAVLGKTIRDLKSSFSKPGYDLRWKVKRYSQELFNEYFHHLISYSENSSECKTLFDNQPTIKTKIVTLFSKLDEPSTSKDEPGLSEPEIKDRVTEKLGEMLTSILEKEGRWQR